MAKNRLLRKENSAKKDGKIIVWNILPYMLLGIFMLTAASAIPSTLTLQGKLTDQNGAAKASTKINFTFKIYDAFTAGNVLWQDDDRNITTDANGIYDVILFNMSALNFSDNYYLGITVGDDNESTPRINLTSSPYSFRANVSEQLNRENKYEVSVLNITGNLTLGEGFDDVLAVTTGRLNITDGDIKTAGNLTLAERISFSLGAIIDNLVSNILKINAKLNVTGNVSIAQDTLFVDNTSGRVGIGTASPINALTIIGDVSAFGSLNATFINATEIRQGLNQVQTINAVFNIVNYSAEYASTGFDRENVSEYLGGASVNASLIKIGNISKLFEENYSKEYAATGFKVANFTTAYDARTERFGRGNVTDYLGEDGNASLLRTINVSKDLAKSFSNFLLANVSNNTLVKGDNSTLALWDRGSSATFLRNTGDSVGIGTATPDNLLTILGNEITANAILHLNASGNFNTSVVNVLTLDHVLKNPVNSTGGVGLSILFRASDNASQLANLANISAILYNATNGSQLSALTFSTREADTGDGSFGHLLERLRIDGFGRVGINDTTPSGALDVDTSSADTLVVVSGKVGIGTATPTNQLEVRGGVNISGGLNVTSGNVLLAVTAGSVGIGTMFPNTKLEVNGTSTFGGDVNVPSNNLNVGGGYSSGGVTLVGTGNDKGSGQFGKNILLDGDIISVFDVEINQSFLPKLDLFSILGNKTQRFLDLFVANIKAGNRTLNITGNVSVGENTLFVDNTSGRVGIGTASPTQLLDVDGNADLGATSGTLYVDSANARVGVGTTAPNDALEVVGNLRVSGSINATSINATSINVTSLILGWTNLTSFPAACSAGQFVTQVGDTLTCSTPDPSSGGGWTDDGTVVRLTTATDLVGIGTTSPQNALDVVGAVTVSKGLNASNLNVTGFSITDDSLVTLADGSKKKIKDIKEGEEVLTLEEKTLNLVPRKVNALLDHGVKPIYEMATEDGRAINTTAEHPYFVKFDSLPNKVSNASDGLITLSGKAFFNPLSPERILQSNLRDKATYGTSFKCGAIDTADFALSSNALKGIISTDLLINSSTSKISSLDSLDREAILSRLLSSSEYIYCVDINSNLPNMSFNSKIKRDLPIVTNAENTTLKSTTKSIVYGPLTASPFDYFIPAEARNLFDIDKLTSSANSFACFSVNLDLETIDSIFFISDNFFLSSSFKNLENNSCNIPSGTFFPNIASNSFLTSSGTFKSNSAILTSPADNNENDYLNFSDKSLGEWIEVRYLKVGDEIAVPDYSTGAIKWEKIASIKTLEPQHVYDLSIEGTRNFIANDIVAHNTYLATSSGNVGIGTTSPAVKLVVIGNANISDSLNVSKTVQATTFIGDGSLLTGISSATPPWNSSGANVYLNDSTAKVGIGTATPDNLLTILGNEITANAILHLNASGNFNTSVVNVLTLDHVLKSPVNSTGGAGVSILFRATDNASQLEDLANISAILYNATNGTELSALTFSTRGADTIDDLSGNLRERLRIDGSGRVGIGTATPFNALTIIGDVSALGSLNATFINATEVRQGVNQVQTINAVFNIVNYSAEYASAGFKIANYSDAYASTGFKIANYSAEYASAGFKRGNASEYLGGASVNASLLKVGNLSIVFEAAFNKGNYSTEYASAGFKRGNVTDYLGEDGNASLLRTVNVSKDLAKSFSNFGLANVSNNTLVKGDNATLALWDRGSSATFLRNTGDSVGIGTTAPQNALDVVGAVTVSKGLNASNLNVTGFSITDDSLVTLADGSKKKIKDIKEGEEVLTLEEKTLNLVPRKVNALLDHGVKPIYEMATESGRAINTTAEHPYFVRQKFYSISNKRLISSVENISTSDCSLNLFSLDQIAQSEDNANAKYGISLACPGNNFKAFDSNFANSGLGTTSIISDSNTKDIINSKPPMPQYLQIFCFNTYNSSNAKSGAISLAPLRYTDLIKFLVKDSGLKNENNIDASTTINLICNTLYGDMSYLLARLSRYSPTSSEKLASDSLLFFNISSATLNKSKTLSLSSTAPLSNAFVAGFLSSSPMISLNLSGISTFNSSILSSPAVNNENDYLKVSDETPLGEWIEVRYLKIGDEIAVPDYSTGTIKWEKIASITVLEPQHVYDLSIEGTRNFIANDIVAHNTYLATTSGNVGIGTTNPAQTLTVQGRVNISQNLTVNNSVLFVDGTSGNVGIGTTSPAVKLVVIGNANISDSLNVSKTVQATTFIGDGSLLTGISAGGSSPWNSSGSNVFLNDSTANVGIGTIKPDNRLTIVGTDTDSYLDAPGILHLNVTDSQNTTLTNIITLDHLLNNPENASNTKAGVSGGIGLGILFRAINNISEIINVSFINATLVDARNGSEAGALTFYTAAPSGVETRLTPRLILNGTDVFIAPNGGIVKVGSNEVQTVNAIFTIVNYSAEYASTGFKRGNVSEYLGGADVNASIIKIGNISKLFEENYSKEYASTGYKLGNFTSNYDSRSDRFGISNGTALPFSNFQLSNVSNNTLTKGDNATLALWDRGSSATFLRNTGDSVGIGTTSPAVKLVVIGNANISGTLNVSGRVAFANLADCNTIDTNANGVLSCGTDETGSGGGSQWNSSGANVFLNDSTASVGIGTTAPNDILEAVGNVRISGSLNATNINASRFYARNGTAALPSYTFIEDTDTGIINIGKAGNNISFVTGGTARMTIDSSGNVGIGTAGPESSLHSTGQIRSDSNFLSVGGFYIRASATDSTTNVIMEYVSGFDIQNRNNNRIRLLVGQGSPAERVRIGSQTEGVAIGDGFVGTASPADGLIVEGNVGIGTAAPTETLTVVGTANITSTLFKGTSAYTNPDIAEKMSSRDQLDFGDVVIADRQNPLYVTSSKTAYDRAVLGVVSANATMVIGNINGDGGTPIAVVGRVRVKATNENGNIAIGDLLTPSETEGHAMKCNDISRCQGAIIGKALEPLSQERGKIWMLVAMQ